MKRILKTRRPLIIYNPTLVFDRDYFACCADAGALPVFDTEFFSDEEILKNLAILEQEAFPFGIRLDINRSQVIRSIENRFIPNLDLIVFSYTYKERLNDFTFNNGHYSFFIEALHIDLNDQLERISPNGLILKGCEAPGNVSPYTSFILMQWYLEKSPFALFIHGGVGLYTAAGLFAAGVSGLVLDNQLYLCDEAPLSPAFKKLVADVTETDTALIGETLEVQYRFFAKLGTRIVKTLKEKESELYKNPEADSILRNDIRTHLCPLNRDETTPLQNLFYLGQDGAFAKSFIKHSSRLSHVIDTFFQSISHQIDAMDAHDPLIEDSPLAREHGTRYPVIQGPMANISDNPAFAKAIYDHGGLPFFAMGNLPADLSETMLAEGIKNVPSFGAGLIGIETFNKTLGRHLDLVKQYKVPFALFAGGIPSQVNELEKAGTKTYLHTPNMMMLDNAIESGCTRFIFEGTEAGGHVGSLSSFVLWEAAMTRLMNQDDQALSRQSLIFAGGISTAYASCFISGLTAILAQKQAKVGIQVGSAYLFTQEIVALNSIGTLYQNTLTQSKKTILTGNTVGLPSRTVPTPFARKLVEQEHARIKDGMSLTERKTVFEEENLGSLLISAKGFLPDIHGTNQGQPICFSEKEQYDRGNFLVGDSLAFLDPGMTIADIHNRYFHEKEMLFTHLNRLEILSSPDSRINDDVAVIGMGCILPDAPNPDTLWDNILSGRYSIGDMPPDRLDPSLYVDTDRQAEDKTYTRIAGLVRDFHFDHEAYGYTPSQAAKLSRSQQMLLETAFQAVENAGYLDENRQFRHDRAGRTGVIIASCLGNERSNDLQLKSYYPEIRSHLEKIDTYQTLSDDQKTAVCEALKQGMSYGDPSEDPADGVALHMEAARIARHLKTDGTAYVVDAACATSFTALDCGMRELVCGRHDTIIMAGNNTNLSPEAFIGFGKMGALSAAGSYPFDQRADGFVLGEGTVVFVLKRLKDAIRQKNTIYGVIRGIGSSSDGKGKAIAAPNPQGQKLALLRCYENMKRPVQPSDIRYIEAHGTSTIMGDQAEIETLKNVYQGETPIGISSIKSQIGHLLGGAGAAGLLKVLLSFKHKTLPPNGQFHTVSSNCDLNESPLYVITNPEPWTTAPDNTRKAAVSSYGFGGINYHVVVEEYAASCPPLPRNVFSDTRDPNDNRIVFAGLGVVVPGALNRDAFEKQDTFVPKPIPEDRFSISHYTGEPDPVFCLPDIKVGIVDDFKFNNVKYRIPPMAAKSIDRAQLFALDAASQSLDQAGSNAILEPGNKTAVILGTVSGRHHAENILRVRAPYLAHIIQKVSVIDDATLTSLGEDLTQSIRSRYPKNTEDTVPGFLSNILSGRIANFFGCNGANFIVDAGDASSAIAMDVAATGLSNGDFEFVLTGGVDANLYPLMMFQYKNQGLLPETGSHPVMSEGGAVMVMTHLKTAREKGLPILGEYLGASFAMDHDNETGVHANLALSPTQAMTPNLGLLRSAETAVTLAGHLLKNQKSPHPYEVISSQACGGLYGKLVTGKPPVSLSDTKQPSVEQTGKRVVALLSGQGAQSPAMMKDLYETIPDIRALMDRGEALFKDARNASLLAMMFGDDPALNLTENTQPAVFLSTAAIYDHIQKQGFAPDFLIGHSVGEFSALYCAGLLDFDQSMNLILTRSSLMKEAAEAVPGKIMVVFDSAETTQDLIDNSGCTVYLANNNSLKQTAVSGKTEDIEQFRNYLADKDIMSTVLTLSGAFHSPLFKTAAEKLGAYMKTLTFDTAKASRIIANVNGHPYPAQTEAICKLLVQQITSPVEFIASVKSVYQGEDTHFVEIGPNRLLANLLKHMDLGPVSVYSAITIKKGQLKSFNEFTARLTDLALIRPITILAPQQIKTQNHSHEKDVAMNVNHKDGDDFSSFVRNNEDHLKSVLYSEYMKHKKQAAIEAFEKFDFNPGKIVVSGVAVGLPGSGKDVFDAKNFDKLLAGTNFIEPLPVTFKDRMVDKNVTKLHKSPDGNARFVEISSTDDVIQLAGQLGYFDLDEQYGIKKHYDTTIGLAMAAGIEALKDAHIPLVMQYKTTSTGSLIQDGYALPEEMQAGTGVILSALWPYSETLIHEMTHYFYNKFYVKPYEELENIYYHLMGHITDTQVKDQVTDWFFKIKERRKIYGDYKMDRDFAHNITPLGSAHFAQFIRAKGPNIQMNGACASTTQAIGIAEDWIRAGRCERVIIIGGETPTSQAQSPWIGSGFLSLGAASVKKNVKEAAKPFDAKRNGTILGSGAVSMILEREETVRRRGMRGQAEVLGTHIGNTAFHVYNIDVKGISKEMNRFVSKIEKRHGLDKKTYCEKMVFMSHETFTPARGGSADAEITALRTTYPDTYKDILISNTKGYTGHTLGAALEDAVLVKVLQTGTAPPIANLQDISDDFKDLRLCTTTSHGDYQYGLHIAAGFGSHLAFAFFKRIEEKSPVNNPQYQAWLQAVTGSSLPNLKETNHTLFAEAGGQKITLAKGLIVEGDQPTAPETLTVSETKDPVVTVQAKEERSEPTPVKNTVPAQAEAPRPALSLLSVIRSIIAEQTGYTEDMLEPALDLEADLGIDTVKQVEIFGKISARFNLKVPENLKLRDLNSIEKLVAYMEKHVDTSALPVQETQSVPIIEVPPQPKTPSLRSHITAVIAEQTGYDADMLEPDLDLEADLGIDTVKQVEIFGKISAAYKLKVPENLKLRDLNTIAKLVTYMEGKVDPALLKTVEIVDDEPAIEPVPAPIQAPVQAPAQEVSSLLNDIKQVIADQTGYEVDMLEPDLDLEADLGIDTVKQVEIFGKISAAHSLKVPENLKLRDLNTIAKLVTYMESRIKKPVVPEPAPEITIPGPTLKTVTTTPSLVKRLTVAVCKDSHIARNDNIFEGKTILVTRDSHGFSDQLCREIQNKGGRVVTLGKMPGSDMKADLCDPQTTIDALKQSGFMPDDIQGLIHLAPLDDYLHSPKTFDFLGKKSRHRNRVAVSLTSFFMLIKTLKPGLDQPGSLIAALSFNSVVFPYQNTVAGPIYPPFAGMAGLMKTVNKEYKDTLVRIIDIAEEHPKNKVDRIVNTFVTELCSGDRRVEKGFRDGAPCVLAMYEKPMIKGTSFICPKDTLLVTGGAMGITYEILKKTVETYKTDLIILGRSPIHDLDSSFLLPGVTTATIMSQVKARMAGAKPLDIKKAVDRIVRTREAVFNIQRLESLGITVCYESVDVTDYAALEQVVKKHRTISGIIHAAGIEESQFIDKKDLASFSRVTDVKIKGLHNLITVMKKRDYRFLITFSSVTARFGNEGQADYTAANDMIGKMVMKEKINHPNRQYKVYSWTAWSGAGMAENDTVKKVLESRGITFLPLAEGIDFFLSDLENSHDTEVVITGLDRDADVDGLLGPLPTHKVESKVLALSPAHPFLNNTAEENSRHGCYHRTLALEQDLFLLDHSMNGTPIFLGATGIETMAEAASRLHGPGVLTEVSDFSIPYGIKILKGRPKDIIIDADVAQDNNYACRISSVFTNPQGNILGEPTLHYQGRFTFDSAYAPAETIELPDFTPLPFEGDVESLIYHPQRLFMDDLFKTLTDVVSFDGDLLITTFQDRSPRPFFRDIPQPGFLTDVVAVDALFQTGGLLEFFTTSTLVLPFKIERLSIHNRVKKNGTYYVLTRKTHEGKETNTYQLEMVDPDGHLYIRIHNFQMVKLGMLDEACQIADRIKILEPA